MKIIHDIAEMREIASAIRLTGKTIGFIPTMGALHAGHMSLLSYAKQHCDYSIVSIFVNPTQFGVHEDFSRYPRPFSDDCKEAEKYGCDLLFNPKADFLYPHNFMTYVNVESLSQKLEGASRPTHFKGVATIVLKFFNIVTPDFAVFGQKDAQQTIVLQRMVKDLNVNTKIVVRPIFREESGLAMSSRNRYLTTNERKEAPIIYTGLQAAKKNYHRGERNVRVLEHCIKNEYNKVPIIMVDYIAFVEMETLQPVDIIKNETLIAIACSTKESQTRLIDNTIIGTKSNA